METGLPCQEISQKNLGAFLELGSDFVTLRGHFNILKEVDSVVCCLLWEISQ